MALLHISAADLPSIKRQIVWELPLLHEQSVTKQPLQIGHAMICLLWRSSLLGQRLRVITPNQIRKQQMRLQMPILLRAHSLDTMIGNPCAHPPAMLVIDEARVPHAHHPACPVDTISSSCLNPYDISIDGRHAATDSLLIIVSHCDLNTPDTCIAMCRTSTPAVHIT